MVTTLIARRSQYHQTILVSHTTEGNQNFENLINGLTGLLAQSGMSLHDATRRAYAMVYQALQQQSATLAYIDTFAILAIGSAIMFVLSFLLKKNDPRAGGEMAVG
jgi:DHA2 family multidrug resistance protein